MSIQKRTVFFDNTGGFVRFWDWAETLTSLGTMAEPFNPNDRHAFGPFDDFDPTDEVALVTCIEQASIDKLSRISGGTHALHGGALNPRGGKR